MHKVRRHIENEQYYEKRQYLILRFIQNGIAPVVITSQYIISKTNAHGKKKAGGFPAFACFSCWLTKSVFNFERFDFKGLYGEIAGIDFALFLFQHIALDNPSDLMPEGK